MRLLPFAALLTLAGAAGAAAPSAVPPPLSEAAAKALAGRTAGRPVECVHLRDVQQTQIIDETAIIYQLGNRRWLVNFPEGGCTSLRKDRALITRTPSDNLCRGDIAVVVDPFSRIESGSCGLGSFVPYTR